MTLHQRLEYEIELRNNYFELSASKPDPLLVAREQTNHYAILLCALYGYGNAFKIVEFLQSLEFNLLDENEQTIKKTLQNHYYRFQNSDDVVNSFLLCKELQKEYALEDLFYEGYKKENNILDGIDTFIETLNKYKKDNRYGLNFLFGKPFKRNKKGEILSKQNAPYKRYNMFLRWMVRNDNLDLGLWSKIDKKDLILPLDTHTFNVCKKFGLLEKGSYNLDSAIKITQKLKKFDNNDPIKYDFALYRIGQEKKN
jgi:uncharacterized protein (TIGR02757 family)